MKRLTPMTLIAFLTAGASMNAEGYEYKLVLKNGSDPSCNISTTQGSRVIIEGATPLEPATLVELSQFSVENGVYTYAWSSNSSKVTVAIQVDLAGMRSPDVWANSGCVYAPEFGGENTTFTQQYLEPDSSYTCSCTSSWDE